MLKKLERNLPATLTELHEYILIGREALKAAMAKIRAIDKVSKSKAAKEAALLDTQDAAEYLLCAEVKLGEMAMHGRLLWVHPKAKACGIRVGITAVSQVPLCDPGGLVSRRRMARPRAATGRETRTDCGRLPLSRRKPQS